MHLCNTSTKTLLIFLLLLARGIFGRLTNVYELCFQEKMFHFWFNTFFVRDHSNPDNGELPVVERSTRALSCDGTAMELPLVLPQLKPRTGSLASLGPMPPTLVLRIDKLGLDDAHKDKHNKQYSADFKVSSFLFVIIKKYLI